MAYWLMKSEPESWSWDQQVKRGAKGEPWTGVRNHQAKRNLMAMKKGDRGFFYHSGETKEIVGIVEVIRPAYPDPTARPGDPWVAVDVKAVAPLPRPVTGAAEAQADGADQQFPPLGPARHRRRMEDRVPDGRGLRPDVGIRSCFTHPASHLGPWTEQDTRCGLRTTAR